MGGGEGVDGCGVTYLTPSFYYDLLAYTRCHCLYVQYTRTDTHTRGINQRLRYHGTPYLLIEACIHNMLLHNMNKWITYINVKTSAIGWKREWMDVSMYMWKNERNKDMKHSVYLFFFKKFSWVKCLNRSVSCSVCLDNCLQIVTKESLIYINYINSNYTIIPCTSLAAGLYATVDWIPVFIWPLSRTVCCADGVLCMCDMDSCYPFDRIPPVHATYTYVTIDRKHPLMYKINICTYNCSCCCSWWLRWYKRNWCLTTNICPAVSQFMELVFMLLAKVKGRWDTFLKKSCAQNYSRAFKKQVALLNVGTCICVMVK